ncbi:MAG: hypothetical protein P4L99_05875 [Chthoniobacter sp.]|nr:hypothetical protein [Chthoniobacter sp.]
MGYVAYKKWWKEEILKQTAPCMAKKKHSSSSSSSVSVAYWVEEEGEPKRDPTQEKNPATKFEWTIYQDGSVIENNSFTGTYLEVYANTANCGFVTWRPPDAVEGPTDFGKQLTLEFYSYYKGIWTPNLFSVSAGFLESAGISDAQIKKVNKRLHPIHAMTSRSKIRGLSSYLHSRLLELGAGITKSGYEDDLFYK